MTAESRQNINEAKGMKLSTYDKPVEKKTTTKLLRVYIGETRSWDYQISHMITKVQNGFRMLYKIRSFTKDSRTLIAIYRSLVEPYFDYCSLVYGTIAQKCVQINCRNSKIEEHALLQKWTIQ